jgi:hypothetical protein
MEEICFAGNRLGFVSVLFSFGIFSNLCLILLLVSSAGAFSDKAVPTFLHKSVVFMQDESQRSVLVSRSRKATEIKQRKQYVQQRRSLNRLSAPKDGHFDWNAADPELVAALNRNRQCNA